MLSEQFIKFKPFWTLVHQTCQSHIQSRELKPSRDIAGAERRHQQELQMSGTVGMRGLPETGRALFWGPHTQVESLAGWTLLMTAISVILLSVPHTWTLQTGSRGLRCGFCGSGCKLDFFVVYLHSLIKSAWNKRCLSDFSSSCPGFLCFYGL